MQRVTIDFGIDLGTTNSTIAVIDGTDAEVIPNKGGSGITPSAVWIDKRGSLSVGLEAKERALVSDPDNADVEFKLRMGLGEKGKKIFARSGREMLPEGLSAEVLKELKRDVQTNKGEQVRAAVITVPAAFELPQADATLKAAELAGFVRSPLLLEPVAASLAYGFQTASENVYWFVYDFGGGTFDAAVMRVRDGLISVVNHEGDNHLGGKLLDWDIVTTKLIPVATEQFNLPDFRRGNPRWRIALGRMKYYAELAKIEVCRTQSPYDIWIEGLCDDADGKLVDFAYTLTPGDVESVSRPYIVRSLGLCRKALKDKGLAGGDMDQILMVGGTTLNPWVREAVAAELSGRLEFRIDPVTVVARGAAIFASTQPFSAVDDGPGTPVSSGSWRLQIEHEPVGNTSDPDIGGKVIAPEGKSPEGCTVELIDKKTKWRSGRIPLGPEGVFMTQLYAEEKRRCEYLIELCDPTGTRIPASPDYVVYTLGIQLDKPPASNSIGVGLANGEMSRIIEKGARLPAVGRDERHTTVSLQAGNPDDLLRIPVLEGEHRRATRNHGVGALLIRGSDIRRDLPVGSKIDITIFIDESQRLRVQAFVPVLDEDFEVTFDLQMQHSSLPDLVEQAIAQKTRLATARERATGVQSHGASTSLARIDDEQLVIQVEALLDAAGEDNDALSQLDRRLRDLTAAVDELETSLEWPALLSQAEVSRVDAGKVVAAFGEDAERDHLHTLEEDLQRAIAAGEPDLLRQRIEELDSLWFQVADRQMAYHQGRFNRLSGQVDAMRDGAQAEQLIAQGKRAIANNDVQMLKSTVRQLMSLLPRDAQVQEDDRVGGVI